MGSQPSTQTTESKPPAWAKPLFEKSATEAQRLYNTGQGGNVYRGDTTAGLGGMTLDGIRGVRHEYASLPGQTSAAANLSGLASGNMLNSSASDKNLNGIASGNMLNSSFGQKNLAGLASGSMLNSSFGQKNLAGLASGAMQDSSYAQKNLSDVASGKYLQSGNPFFKQALEGQLNDTAAQVQSSFAGSGRYGSGANAGVLTSQLGNIRANAMSDQYNRDMQNMLTANGQIDAARAGLRQDMMGANGQIDATRANLLQNMLSANGQIDATRAGLTQNMLTANGQIDATRAGLRQDMLTANGQIDAANSNLFQNKLQGAQAQIGAGKLLDQARQAELDAAQNRFLAKDNRGWNRLGLLQSAAAGSAGNYGINTQVQKSGSNPLSTIGGIGSLLTK